MSWLNLNQSFNSLKGQISNFASEVLSENTAQDIDTEDSGIGPSLKELQEKCHNQEQEISALKALNDELQAALQSEVNRPLVYRLLSLERISFNLSCAKNSGSWRYIIHSRQLDRISMKAPTRARTHIRTNTAPPPLVCVKACSSVSAGAASTLQSRSNRPTARSSSLAVREFEFRTPVP
ncbi:unnamed protein product, partial [Iphiclides podalirius]